MTKVTKPKAGVKHITNSETFIFTTEKYRFKTKQEFDETCKKYESGAYRCGNNTFVLDMYPLFGVEYKPIDNLMVVECDGDIWNVTPEMLVCIREY